MQSQLGSAPGLSTGQSQLPPPLGLFSPLWPSPMGSRTKHFAVTEALSASVTCANHWFNDCYMSFWECLREEGCSLQNYSPCWGKTVTDYQELFTRAKKLGSAWVPRAWQVSQTQFEYVDCDSGLLLSHGHALTVCRYFPSADSPDRYFWAICASVGQHIQSLETIPRGTCMLMVNIRRVNMPTCWLIYRQNMGKKR